MRLWRTILNPKPHRPWWVLYTPDTREPNPNFRPPKSRPGQNWLRDRLSELFAVGAYREFRQELGLSKEAIARFMAGENDALTKPQTQSVARYVSEFGLSMSTGKFIRRARREVVLGEAQTRRRLALFDLWRKREPFAK